jgi:hypothetical protein
MDEAQAITISGVIPARSSTRGRTMATETKCLTSGAIFHISIQEHEVSATVDLPFKLDITAEEAEILESLIHNQLELVLRVYFESR